MLPKDILAVFAVVPRLSKRFILALPAPVRYFLSVLAFWPTAIINRVICWLCPSRRRLWDRITDSVILGSVPFRRSELETLYHKEKVRGVVNMCKEWDWHKEWYPTLGIQQLWLPTIDYDTPELQAGLAGAQFIREHELRGESVYVHCKAGRGRSTTIVLCYLVLFRGLSPVEADRLIRGYRSQISERYSSDTVQRCYELVKGGSLKSLDGKVHVPEAVRALLQQCGRGHIIEPTMSHEAADKLSNIDKTD